MPNRRVGAPFETVTRMCILLMPGFTSIEASQKCTSAIFPHGSTRQRSSSTNTSDRHSVKSMASTGGAKVSRTRIGRNVPQRWNPILNPFAEPYCYTTLVHLKDVFEKRWDLFSKLLPAGLASDRKRFLSSRTRLNLIRNGVMHASKCVVPNEDDPRFLREFLDFAQILQRHERLTGPTKSDASIA